VDEVASKGARVDIWNYSDDLLKPVQKNSIRSNERTLYLSSIDLRANMRVKRLQDDDEPLGILRMDNRCAFALATFPRKHLAEGQSSYGNREDIYIISTQDGSRRLIKRNVLDRYLRFSPNGRYVIWFDQEKGKWFTYNIVTGVIKGITEGISGSLYLENDTHGLPVAAGIGGWIDEDKAVIIYGRYDVWMVDPNGIKPPIDLTAGYGSKNLMVFRPLEWNGPGQGVLHGKDTLLLSAFDRRSKKSGFYSRPLGNAGNLRQLTMGPFAWYFYPGGSDLCRETFHLLPLRSRDGKTYILQRMNFEVYPNLLSTSNFTEFNILTDLAPQKEFIWYTNELVRWKMHDGRSAEGILYKPDNFDPRKKYPVIFYYYQKNSDALNLFLTPELSNGCLDVALCVSNGYVVFVPNIYYRIGYPGQSACNSVVSAAKHLGTFPWVDIRKMALQGHSFGGYETNFIITRTSLFAAAASSAGSDNYISEYGSLWGNGTSKHEYFLTGQGRVGQTLWKRPALYVENSPIFRADRVKTPLLIMHNKGDESVSWTLAVEWFTGLQSLGKKVWMLQYDGEGHILGDRTNKLDYTIRLRQFYDHYLKGANMPKWMTNGNDLMANKVGTNGN
jgi:hypothetical protein